MGNYSFKTTGLPEPVNGVVERHNLTQGTPHKKIYVGTTGLAFRRCNLTNCDVPNGSIIDKCQTSQLSFCSHLHQSWAEKGFITECIEECIHVTSIDTITVDGIVVDTNYIYSDLGVE